MRVFEMIEQLKLCDQDAQIVLHVTSIGGPCREVRGIKSGVASTNLLTKSLAIFADRIVVILDGGVL